MFEFNKDHFIPDDQFILVLDNPIVYSMIPTLAITENETRDRVIVISDTSYKQPCCKCKRSQCRKRYCVCFNKGISCSRCNCKECFNKGKPYYYYNVPQSCNCKATECRKKYCICFENNKTCSDTCKCKQCLNH